MDYAKESLRLHGEWKGKIEVIATVPVATKDDLSLAYTPGVAQPCLEIQKDISKSYELTRRHNLCAVITDGSAVLGLGDIGPEAGMPVMEGKCVLFKSFGGVDAFPLCIKTHDVDEFVNAVYLLSGSFGGINLEDISAPRCFEIERKLKEKCDIPIFHDDQHGTAVITLAGLTNALKVVGKNKEDVKVVTSGAGAAAVSIVKLLLSAGFKHITMCDRKGAIYKGREGLNWIKEKIGEEYLIPLIGVYDSFEEIDFSSFPERFVLKTNHACNNTIVVKYRSLFDKKYAAEKFKEWLSYDFAFRFGYQMQYHPIKRKIIAEEFIENGGDDLFDYKFYCFDGKPLFCKLIGGRAKDPRLGMFDMEWNPLPYHETVHPLFDEMPDKPARYDRLVEIAGILCQGFPFVRVDLYHLDDGSIKFGEMTFTPGSGQSTWLPEGTDEMLGAMIPIP